MNEREEARIRMDQVWHEIQCRSLTEGLPALCNCRPKDVHADCRAERDALQRDLAQAREDLQEWEELADVMRSREGPWIARWQQEMGKPDALPDYGDMLGWLVGKLEESRAALAEVRQTLRLIRTYAVPQESDVLEDFKACATLIVEQVDIALARAEGPGGEPAP